MKTNRRIALRREVLTELATAEMSAVVGASHVVACATHGYSCDECPVPSLPLNTCACQTLGESCIQCS